MKQPNKKDILKKWAPILESMGMTGSKAEWMSQYANAHIDNEKERDNKIITQVSNVQAFFFYKFLKEN